MTRGATAAVLVLVAVGCAAGSTRQVEIGPLGWYQDARAIEVAAAGAGDAALHARLAGAARRAFDEQAQPPAGTSSMRLAITVVEARAPQAAAAGTVDQALGRVRSFAGLVGVAGGETAGRLVLEAALMAPDGARVGTLRWEKEGELGALADEAGADLARALAGVLPERRRAYYPRRAADERLLLTPTPQTLAPGEVVVSDDEVLLARLAVGLGSRVQLDFWTGGFPVPAAGGFGYAGHGIAAVGGAGAAVIGFLDLGLKVRILDETEWRPAIGVAYDLLDVFGLASGAGGLVLFGNGAGGGGVAVVGGANAQFNLFSAVVGKHLGPFQLTLGTYVLDNRHYLPQSAAFQAGCGFAATDSMATTAGGAPCGSGAATLPRAPTQVQPFAGSELVLGPHSALIAEVLPTDPVQHSLVTTGARWLLGGSRPRGPVALDRIRFRIDLAALWFYVPARDGMMPRKAAVLPLPWLGVGVYFL